MKKKTVYPRLSVCSLLMMALVSGCILIQTGCNNSGAQTVSQAGQKGSTNWTSLDITFKPNTNEEWREESIMAIEKMLIKSVTPYTKQYSNFYPSITITKMPFWDSLRYRISVLNTYFTGSGDPKPLFKTITPCPPCPGYCAACDSTKDRVSVMY
ncbi:MAG: hypothetical protein ACHQF0_17700, partial [Chitinophagales bacterium]